MNQDMLDSPNRTCDGIHMFIYCTPFLLYLSYCIVCDKSHLLSNEFTKRVGPSIEFR